MSTYTQNRQPAGVPVGGQFAATIRATAGISLGGLDEHEDTTDAAERPWGAGSREEVWSEIHGLAMQIMRRKVTGTALEHGGFAEDGASEVVYHLLTREQKDVSITPALVRTTALSVFSRASHANRTGSGRENLWRASSSDMGAWRQYQAQVKEIEQITGRAMNSKELDEVAGKIRETWPDQRHRPRVGFHLEPGRESTLDDTTEAFAPRVTSAEEEYMRESEGAYMAAALDAIADPNFDRRDKTPERMLHNALAEGRGVPVAAQGVLSQRAATSVRSLVGTTNAAVAETVRSWEDEGDSPRSDALFAPYGRELSYAEKAAVVEMYQERPDFAAAIFGSAVSFANSRNATLPDPGARVA